MYYATADDMAKLDRLAVESGLSIVQMMELAGWHMLEVFDDLDIDKSSKVVVVAGKGNKGGDGLAAARHLINYGYDVSVVLASPKLKDNPKQHLDLLEEMGVKMLLYSQAEKISTQEIKDADVIIDSLIGYNLDGAPRDDFGELVKIINQSSQKTISYDLPTGMDATTGHCFSPCIDSDAVLTLALPKRGFKEAEAFIDQIYLGDIGIPDFLYNKIKQKSRPSFDQEGVIKLDLAS